jgi:hypothetical protein
MRTSLLVIVAALGAAAPATAQDTAVVQPAAARQAASIPHKSAAVATGVSLLSPGVGHLYAGETGKGVALLGIGWGSLIVGTYMWERGAVESITDCDTFDCAVNGTVKQAGWAYAGMGVFLVTYIYGIADAGNAAHRVNERNARKAGIALAGATFEPIVAPTPRGVGLGMRVPLGR